MPLCASSVRVALASTALLIAAAPAQAAKPAEKPDAARVVPSALPPNAPRHFDATEAIAHDPATRTDGSDDIVTLRHDAADRMTVMVEIGTVAGTHSAFAFLVDTGAERTVVARSVVNALGLVPNGRGRLIGMAGAQDVDLVLDELHMVGEGIPGSLQFDVAGNQRSHGALECQFVFGREAHGRLQRMDRSSTAAQSKVPFL